MERKLSGSKRECEETNVPGYPRTTISNSFLLLTAARPLETTWNEDNRRNQST